MFCLNIFRHFQSACSQWVAYYESPRTTVSTKYHLLHSSEEKIITYILDGLRVSKIAALFWVNHPFKEKFRLKKTLELDLKIWSFDLTSKMNEKLTGWIPRVECNVWLQLTCTTADYKCTVLVYREKDAFWMARDDYFWMVTDGTWKGNREGKNILGTTQVFFFFEKPRKANFV